MTAYRDSTEIVDQRAHRLRLDRLAELEQTPTGLRSVYVRRSARIAFGVAGTAGALLTFGSLYLLDHGSTNLLLASWALAVAAYFGAAAIASLRLERALRRAVARSSDPFADALRLRDTSPRALERALSGGREHASFAWPLLAVTLLGPYTLQLAYFALDGAAWSEFDAWMKWTMLFVVHVHGYAAHAAWQYPRRRQACRSLAVAAGLAMVPGGIFLGLPSLITLITGAVLIVVFWLPLRRVMDRELSAMALAAAHE